MKKYLTKEELLETARTLIGKSIYQIALDKVDLKTIRKPGKGIVGNLIEKYGFGIPNNSRSEPDFANLGIELKILPLIKKKKGLTIKERTKICSINYVELIKETWSNSHCKEKINEILFVAYEYNDSDIFSSIIKDCFIYDLNERHNDHLIIKADWLRAQQMVEDGEAHELSEKYFTYLAASTSGVGKMKIQPMSDLKAKERSFSLKPSYTRLLWQDRLNRTKSMDSLFDLEEFTVEEGVRPYLLRKLKQIEGKKVVDVAKGLGVDLKSGKASSSNFMRALLGFKKGKKHIRELAMSGVTVRVIPVNPRTNTLRESVSFPHQTFQEILDEPCFEESALFEWLSEMLFIPVYRGNSASDPDRKIGKAFFWNPSITELREIQDEWELARLRINQLKIQSEINKPILASSETKYIHVRPHARNKKDTEYSIGLEVTKQSFWLNSKYVSNVL